MYITYSKKMTPKIVPSVEYLYDDVGPSFFFFLNLRIDNILQTDGCVARVCDMFRYYYRANVHPMSAEVESCI